MGPKKPSNRAGRWRNRPGLEALEGRCLLASVVDFSTPTSDASPYEITAAPDGNLWFTEANGGKVGMINATTDAIRNSQSIKPAPPRHSTGSRPDPMETSGLPTVAPTASA